MKKSLRALWGTENGTCPKCGNAYSSRSLFCDQCGSRLSNESWDGSIRKLTTEIMKGLMKRSDERYYTVEKNGERIYGKFFKLNVSDRDIKYIINALKGSKFNVDIVGDRIYFDISTDASGAMTVISDLASQLNFQQM